MLHLAWPWLLAAAPAPWVLRALLAPAPAGGGGLYAPLVAGLLGREQGAQPAGPGRGLRALAVLAWLLLLLAAARPQWLGEPLALPEAGRNLMLAVDVSGSMEREDLDLSGARASRLDVVKQVAGEFIARREGDRVGLILFGTRPYLQTPLTFDRQTVRTFLDEAAIGLAGRETAIGDAIGLAIKRLREAPQGEAVLILLTDGANTAGALEPRKAAELAAGQGLTIYTIGVGAERAVVRGLLGNRVVNPSRDLDEATLKAIAEATGGRFFRATDRQALEAVYRTLDELEPVEGGERVVRPVDELYPWPLGAALVLTLLLAAWPMRPGQEIRGA
jgi:Ca-activated chloride channel family protein